MCLLENHAEPVLDRRARLAARGNRRSSPAGICETPLRTAVSRATGMRAGSRRGRDKRESRRVSRLVRFVDVFPSSDDEFAMIETAPFPRCAPGRSRCLLARSGRSRFGASFVCLFVCLCVMSFGSLALVPGLHSLAALRNPVPAQMWRISRFGMRRPRSCGPCLFRPAAPVLLCRTWPYWECPGRTDARTHAH